MCLAVEGMFWTIFGKMKDGTPCPPTEKGYKEARCAGGYCLVSKVEIREEGSVIHNLITSDSVHIATG